MLQILHNGIVYFSKKDSKSEVKSLSHVRLFATPWSVAHQAPLSMGFSRQEYWSGLPFPSTGDLPDPGIEPGSPALQTDALPSEPRQGDLNFKLNLKFINSIYSNESICYFILPVLAFIASLLPPAVLMVTERLHIGTESY